MHPHLAEVFALLDQSRAALRAAVATVEPGDRARRPGPDRWSVNEILEHLGLVERSFGALVSEAIAKARSRGPRGRARRPRAAPGRPARRGPRSPRAAEGPRQCRPDRYARRKGAHGTRSSRAAEQFRATVSAAEGPALGTVTATHRRWGAVDDLPVGRGARHPRGAARRTDRRSGGALPPGRRVIGMVCRRWLVAPAWRSDAIGYGTALTSRGFLLGYRRRRSLAASLVSPAQSPRKRDVVSQVSSG